MASQTEVNEAVRIWLDEIAGATVAALRDILSKPFPSGTEIFDFELHHGHWEQFPIVGYPMDRGADQHGVWFFKIIPGLPATVANNPAYETDDVSLSDAISKAIFPWFADRWHDAGGPAAGLPAYVCHHDDIESFDMNAKKWISDSEKWD